MWSLVAARFSIFFSNSPLFWTEGLGIVKGSIFGKNRYLMMLYMDKIEVLYKLQMIVVANG